MILFTYSSNENQNFEILQDFLFLKFPNEYVKECCDFCSCGRKTNEISLLFLENEIRVFYSLPRKDEFDTILLNNKYDFRDFLYELYNLLTGDIDISVHLSDNNIRYSDNCIKMCFLEDVKDDMINFFKNKNEVNCSLHTSPYFSKDILVTIHTYDDELSSVTKIIDGSQKNNFVPRFFTLVRLLSIGDEK